MLQVVEGSVLMEGSGDTSIKLFEQMMLPETKDGPVRHVVWTFYDHMQCPQQPEDYECGYYVMKWMYDITFYYCKAAEIQFEQDIATSPMSMIDMNVAREVWANKCLDNIHLV